ncbi:alpha/beta fold hydrolase [Alteromonas sp. McT4-15]|uniref:alpha/beta hydrolase family protein n=1 Tax=Alteromonas sp. McT4-15 TaxID=2881256 RepID=UPI001CF83D0B|nr:alpha/beta fold hydrolase [Alteromonas sp. McT4-15]MCB4436606.1 alpha/beta fold hydrolase [Alteromonas sp. McT4-15]
MNTRWQLSVYLWLCVSWAGIAMNASYAAHENNEYVPIERAKQVALSKPKSALISRAVFNKEQPVESVLLSPDGLKISYVIKENKRKQLWVYDVASDNHVKLITAHNLENLSWTADSNRLVYVDAKRVVFVGLSKQQLAQTRYRLKDANTLFVKTDRHNPDAFWLLKYNVSQSMYSLIKVDSHSNLKKDSHSDEQSDSHSHSKSDSHTNESIQYRSPLPIMNFWADDRAVRFVSLMDNDYQSIVQLLVDGEREIIKCEVFDACKIQHWSAQTHTLLLSGQIDNDTATLHAINTRTGIKEAITNQNSPPFDASQFFISPDGKPFLLGYETQYVHYEALTPNAEALLNRLTSKISNNIYRFTPDKSLTNWLVAEEDQQSGNVHFRLYLAESDTWISPLSHIEPSQTYAIWSALRVPIQYQASDGMPLFGYLTLPNGYKASEVPLVVFPHGGPWNRSHGSYNRISQFMANRGYAVFEPNFRGSTGMGQAYMTSAQRDFGNGRVQQDIIDGVDYLLENGVGRADRLAIVGHSFGGFSAINALAFTPDKFSVAFAAAAPNNMSDTIRHYKSSILAVFLPMRLPRFSALMSDITNRQDVLYLYEQSPDKHWQNIDKPLYMWAGAQDDRVAVEDVREFALRLQADGKAISLVSDAREGHSPNSTLAKDGYLYLLERALFTHLHGRMETKMTPSLTRYFDKFMTIDTNSVSN